MKRRDFIKKMGIAAGAAAALPLGLRLGPAFAAKGGKGPKGGAGTGGEPMPVSPLILNPFNEPLPVPQPLAPVTDPSQYLLTQATVPGKNQPQDSRGETHQLWVDGAYSRNTPPGYTLWSGFPLPAPTLYHIKLQVAPHSFTSSQVRDARTGAQSSLPDSTIYGFNGTFPGPMIYARYGQPALVRFENFLDQNPLNLPRGDFGVQAFLTHLHNAHTAAESDGNPHHRPPEETGPFAGFRAYEAGEFVDNLYLNWPPDNDNREKQSYFWFHDHVMDHTSENVYKGMVGIYPIYDPELDPGDETQGLRLPGVPNPVTGRVDYDIPLVFYDCALDDGVTPHAGEGQDGLAHPENYGKTFFAHYINDGFVGDIFTVNGKAFPYLPVKRRKYRLRFLDASIARWYEFQLMQGSPELTPGLQGQYQLKGAQQVMQFTQIASEGGLLPAPLVRDSIPIAPAKRREMIVDFTRYQDGSPTSAGDVIYLTNILKMSDGRKPDGRQGGYNVPVLKFVIDGDPPTPDLSLIPAVLRPLPPLPPPNDLNLLPQPSFELHRSGGMWRINDLLFDPMNPIHFPQRNRGEVWTLINGGGGWTHPMHMHMEEHQILSRDGSPPAAPDISKEDVVALAPGEEVVFYRNFRTFTGKYVAHCHNLIHEDHAMMFAWTILPEPGSTP